MPTLTIREFTDPGCPFAFSAEPTRMRLRWLFGGQLRWGRHMVGLSESAEEYAEKGFTPEKQASSMAGIQRRYGMPIDPARRPRMAATVPACRAVVATRLHARGREDAILRRLRIRHMGGELLDDPSTIAGAARDAGVPAGELTRWLADPEVERVLRADMDRARHPSAAALALDHKLASWTGGRRYTCPSYEIEAADGRRIDVPGFQPFAVYETAIANLAPELERRADPESVAEVLEWAGEPLATAEVAAVSAREIDDVRAGLARTGAFEPVGADGYWTPDAVPERLVA